MHMADTQTQQAGHVERTERAPIITVMGHVDHGKSTLLDYIRKTNVVEGEAGGITQHLSAYEVEHTGRESGKTKHITFLDTPGHAAFSDMRSRGATVADIAILVVSAEDGVKEQTLEALRMIKEANIPYIVAITKTDKQNADVNWAKNNLLENEIYIEGYGGDVSCVPVSAQTGEGIDELMDMVLLQAELAELMGDPTTPASGVVIESHVDPKKGTSATLLIKNGTLKKGQFVVAEESYSPVRVLENFAGRQIDEASLSQPVRVTGFNSAPAVGSIFHTYASKKEAEHAAADFAEGKDTSQRQSEEVKADEAASVTVPVILKADTGGTAEALEQVITELDIPYVSIEVVSCGTGDIAESDAKVASGVENPVIIGFNVKIDKRAEPLLKQHELPVHLFDVIYKVTEWLEEEARSRVPREMKEEEVGKAEILRIFSSEEKGKQIVGGRVIEGAIRKSEFNILRRDNKIGSGKIVELQHQKDRVEEVSEGKEFGAMLEAKKDVAKGDILQVFTVNE